MSVKTFEDEANEVAKKLGYGINTVGSELIRQALLSAYENGKAFQHSVEPTVILCDEGCGKVAEFHRCLDHIT